MGIYVNNNNQEFSCTLASHLPSAMAPQASIPQLQRCQALQKLLSLQEDLASLTRRQNHQSNVVKSLPSIYRWGFGVWQLNIMKSHEITTQTTNMSQFLGFGLGWMVASGGQGAKIHPPLQEGSP